MQFKPYWMTNVMGRKTAANAGAVSSKSEISLYFI
jgi:hypothetical protein